MGKLTVVFQTEDGKSFEVEFNEDEAVVLRAKAKALGMPVQEYVKKKVFRDGEPAPRSGAN